MCTAALCDFGDGYFGRTLDLECTFGEKVTITPRNFRFSFGGEVVDRHYAIIGMALAAKGYPLYYDAVNEKGLCIAGLNFPKSAKYLDETEGKINLASFEFIPYILSKCQNIQEALNLLHRINITSRAFSRDFVPTPLHFMLADRERSLVVEPMCDGLHIYENKVGVLTNEPPFDAQLANLCKYANLTAKEPSSDFLNNCSLEPQSRALGAAGLPGDWSSQSRFVRAAFVLKNSVVDSDNDNAVGQFFKILGAVEMPKGSIILKNGKEDITQYTSCMNMSRGVYYYKTHNNSRINAVDLRKENLDSESLIEFKLKITQDILMHN